MPKQVPELGFYYHYKHNPNGTVQNYAYEVLGVGFHTEEARDGEAHFVIYRPLYDASVYSAARVLGIPCFDARPLDMWMGTVTQGGRSVSRFSKITDQKSIQELARIRDTMYPRT